MTWYDRSKVFAEGVQLINKLPNVDFKRIILENDEFHFYETSDDSDSEVQHGPPKSFTKDEGALLQRTILYLVNRLNLFLLTPTSIQKDLKELELDDDKIDILLKYYCDITKNIVKDIEPDIESSPKNDQIYYDLKTVYASDILGRTKQPVARLVLKLNNQSLDMEMRHEDVSKMFEGLELIQSELDDISSKK